MEKKNKNGTFIVIGILGYSITKWITHRDFDNIVVPFIASITNYLFLYIMLYSFLIIVKDKLLRNINITANYGKKTINIKQTPTNDYKVTYDDKKENIVDTYEQKENLEDTFEQNEDPIGKLK